jgi:subtilisin-like proprotein convertase family protein
MLRYFIVLLSTLSLISCGGGGGGGSSSCGNCGFNIGTVASGVGNLSAHLWHINNTGMQQAFATNPGTAGEDINFGATTQTGSAIIVAVVDDGLEITHEDLKDNVVADGSYDFTDNDNNPTNSGTDGGHGTSVAGLIAASDNNAGAKGVAPSAKLKGFNALENQSENNFISSLGGNTLSNDVDIFNQSYGHENNDDFLISSTMEAHYKYGVNNLRNNKGTIYVKAAGNGYESFGSVACVSANYSATTCQNSNMDPENSIPYNIVVGAINANGIKTSYSTTGSSLWISAPSSDSSANLPGLITTDKSGCDRGYSKSSSSANNFENNNNSQNPECNYTSTFGGTSGATPIVSGVVALMLEAEQNLTWRDVKHILANTAEKVDANIATTTVTINGSSYNAEPAWLTNAAGYNFHNYYGFGRIDTTRAIASATGYVSNLGNFTQTNWESNNVNQVIPDNSTVGVIDTINTTNNLTIEAVQIRVNISHTYTGELAIELVSPSGTRSIPFTIFNGFASSNNLDIILLSNAFYGENTNGNWQIKVIDGGDRGSAVGNFNNWQIRFFGH